MKPLDTVCDMSFSVAWNKALFCGGGGGGGGVLRWGTVVLCWREIKQQARPKTGISRLLHYAVIIINIYSAHFLCEYIQMRVTTKYETNQT